MTLSAPSRTVPDLSYLLTHSGYVLATRMTAAMAEIGLTPRGYCVLFHAMQAERTQAELAAISDMDKTTMVATMDGLERSGWAERHPSAHDRRARIVTVTAEGRRMAERGTRVADRVHREAVDSLPEELREALLDGLRRLTEGHLATPVESPRPVRRARQR